MTRVGKSSYRIRLIMIIMNYILDSRWIWLNMQRVMVLSVLSSLGNRLDSSAVIHLDTQ